MVHLWKMYQSAKELASKMITIGKGANRNTWLYYLCGWAFKDNIGNATEVIEAIELLKVLMQVAI